MEEVIKKKCALIELKSTSFSNNKTATVRLFLNKRSEDTEKDKLDTARKKLLSLNERCLDETSNALQNVSLINVEKEIMTSTEDPPPDNILFTRRERPKSTTLHILNNEKDEIRDSNGSAEKSYDNINMISNSDEKDIITISSDEELTTQYEKISKRNPEKSVQEQNITINESVISKKKEQMSLGLSSKEIKDKEDIPFLETDLEIQILEALKQQISEANTLPMDEFVSPLFQPKPWKVKNIKEIAKPGKPLVNQIINDHMVNPFSNISPHEESNKTRTNGLENILTNVASKSIENPDNFSRQNDFAPMSPFKPPVHLLIGNILRINSDNFYIPQETSENRTDISRISIGSKCPTVSNNRLDVPVNPDIRKDITALPTPPYTGFDDATTSNNVDSSFIQTINTTDPQFSPSDDIPMTSNYSFINSNPLQTSCNPFEKLGEAPFTTNRPNIKSDMSKAGLSFEEKGYNYNCVAIRRGDVAQHQDIYNMRSNFGNRNHNNYLDSYRIQSEENIYRNERNEHYSRYEMTRHSKTKFRRRSYHYKKGFEYNTENYNKDRTRSDFRQRALSVGRSRFHERRMEQTQSRPHNDDRNNQEKSHLLMDTNVNSDIRIIPHIKYEHQIYQRPFEHRRQRAASMDRNLIRINTQNSTGCALRDSSTNLTQRTSRLPEYNALKSVRDQNREKESEQIYKINVQTLDGNKPSCKSVSDNYQKSKENNCSIQDREEKSKSRHRRYQREKNLLKPVNQKQSKNKRNHRIGIKKPGISGPNIKIYNNTNHTRVEFSRIDRKHEKPEVSPLSKLIFKKRTKKLKAMHIVQRIKNSDTKIKISKLKKKQKKDKGDDHVNKTVIKTQEKVPVVKAKRRILYSDSDSETIQAKSGHYPRYSDKISEKNMFLRIKKVKKVIEYSDSDSETTQATKEVPEPVYSLPFTYSSKYCCKGSLYDSSLETAKDLYKPHQKINSNEVMEPDTTSSLSGVKQAQNIEQQIYQRPFEHRRRRAAGMDYNLNLHNTQDSTGCALRDSSTNLTQQTSPLPEYNALKSVRGQNLEKDSERIDKVNVKTLDGSELNCKSVSDNYQKLKEDNCSMQDREEKSRSRHRRYQREKNLLKPVNQKQRKKKHDHQIENKKPGNSGPNFKIYNNTNNTSKESSRMDSKHKQPEVSPPSELISKKRIKKLKSMHIVQRIKNSDTKIKISNFKKKQKKDKGDDHVKKTQEKVSVIKAKRRIIYTDSDSETIPAKSGHCPTSSDKISGKNMFQRMKKVKKVIEYSDSDSETMQVTKDHSLHLTYSPKFCCKGSLYDSSSEMANNLYKPNQKINSNEVMEPDTTASLSDVKQAQNIEDTATVVSEKFMEQSTPKRKIKRIKNKYSAYCNGKDVNVEEVTRGKKYDTVSEETCTKTNTSPPLGSAYLSELEGTQSCEISLNAVNLSIGTADGTNKSINTDKNQIKSESNGECSSTSERNKLHSDVSSSNHLIEYSPQEDDVPGRIKECLSLAQNLLQDVPKSILLSFIHGLCVNRTKNDIPDVVNTIMSKMERDLLSDANSDVESRVLNGKLKDNYKKIQTEKEFHCKVPIVQKASSKRVRELSGLIQLESFKHTSGFNIDTVNQRLRPRTNTKDEEQVNQSSTLLKIDFETEKAENLRIQLPKSKPSNTQVTGESADEHGNINSLQSTHIYAPDSESNEIIQGGRLDEKVCPKPMIQSKLTIESKEFQEENTLTEINGSEKNIAMNQAQPISDGLDGSHFKVIYLSPNVKKYVCCINGTDNHYTTDLLPTLLVHVKKKHAEVWDGYCSVCKKTLIMSQEEHNFATCLEHMINSHNMGEFSDPQPSETTSRSHNSNITLNAKLETPKLNKSNEPRVNPSSMSLTYAHFKIDCTDFKSQKYVCCIGGNYAHFKTAQKISMINHLRVNHSEEWNGYCYICKKVVMPQGLHNFCDYFKHMIVNHLDNFPVLDQVEANQEISLPSSIATLPIYYNSADEANQEPEECQERKENGLIKNVFETAKVNSFGEDIKETSSVDSPQQLAKQPLPTGNAILLSFLLKSDEDEIECSNSKVIETKRPFKSLPKGANSIDRRELILSAGFSQPLVEKNNCKPKRPYYEYEEQQARVMKAKHDKVSMLSEIKLVHIYKCAGRFCVYTTNSPDKAELHALTHQKESEIDKSVLMCAYCNFDCKGEAKSLVNHVFKTHGHCKFSCSQCSNSKVIETKRPFKSLPKGANSIDRRELILSAGFSQPLVEKNNCKPKRPYYEYEEQQARVMKAKHDKVSMLSEIKLVHIYKCAGRFCVYTTNSPDKAELHALTHQKESEIDKSVLMCAYCNFDCKGEAKSLVNHVFKTHGHCKFSCSQCFYRAVASQLVFAHMQRVHGSTNEILEAPTPVYDLSTESLSPEHEIMGYLCANKDARNPECQHPCFTKESFVNHLRNHTSPYFCFICAHPAVHPTDLLMHLSGHGLKQFHCSWCSDGADSKEDFLAHFSARHPARQPTALTRNVTGIHEGTKQTSVLPLVKFNEPNIATKLVTLNSNEKDSDSESILAVRQADKSHNLEELITVISNLHHQSESQEHKPHFGDSEILGISSSEQTLSQSLPTANVIYSNNLLSAVAEVNPFTKRTQNTASNDIRFIKYLRRSQLETETSENMQKCARMNAPNFVLDLRNAKDPGNSTVKQLSLKAASGYPKYVPDMRRYICGAKDCLQNTIDKATLKHHWETLHSSNDFKCVHCQSSGITISLQNWTQIEEHLNMHSDILYVCAICNAYHYRYEIVEKHIYEGAAHLRTVNDQFNTPVGHVAISTMSTIPMQSKHLINTKEPIKRGTNKKGANNNKTTCIRSTRFKCTECEYIDNSELNIKKHKHETHGSVPELTGEYTDKTKKTKTSKPKQNNAHRGQLSIRPGMKLKMSDSWNVYQNGPISHTMEAIKAPSVKASWHVPTIQAEQEPLKSEMELSNAYMFSNSYLNSSNIQPLSNESVKASWHVPTIQAEQEPLKSEMELSNAYMFSNSYLNSSNIQPLSNESVKASWHVPTIQAEQEPLKSEMELSNAYMFSNSYLNSSNKQPLSNEILACPSGYLHFNNRFQNKSLVAKEVNFNGRPSQDHVQQVKSYNPNYVNKQLWKCSYPYCPFKTYHSMDIN